MLQDVRRSPRTLEASREASSTTSEMVFRYVVSISFIVSFLMTVLQSSTARTEPLLSTACTDPLPSTEHIDPPRPSSTTKADLPSSAYRRRHALAAFLGRARLSRVLALFRHSSQPVIPFHGSTEVQLPAVSDNHVCLTPIFLQ